MILGYFRLSNIVHLKKICNSSGSFHEACHVHNKLYTSSINFHADIQMKVNQLCRIKPDVCIHEHEHESVQINSIFPAQGKLSIIDI